MHKPYISCILDFCFSWVIVLYDSSRGLWLMSHLTYIRIITRERLFEKNMVTFTCINLALIFNTIRHTRWSLALIQCIEIMIAFHLRKAFRLEKGDSKLYKAVSFKYHLPLLSNFKARM